MIALGSMLAAASVLVIAIVLFALRAGQVQIDVKFIEPLKGSRKKHYQFTAIDDCTRLRVLRIYDRLGQKTAIQFVDYVLEKLPFHVLRIQTDNGSEFQAQFHWHVLDRGIEHVYIKPATPRLNGKVERSHRIDAEEFYRMLGGVVVDDSKLFTSKLQEWEDFYNFDRPHGALGGQTPYDRLREKVAAPASAATVSCTTSPLGSRYGLSSCTRSCASRPRLDELFQTPTGIVHSPHRIWADERPEQFQWSWQLEIAGSGQLGPIADRLEGIARDTRPEWTQGPRETHRMRWIPFREHKLEARLEAEDHHAALQDRSDAERSRRDLTHSEHPTAPKTRTVEEVGHACPNLVDRTVDHD